MRVVDGWDFDIAAIGEILVDFTDCGLSEYGTRLFSQNPGGAVANVAAAASRLGMRTAFIGKVGADMHGEFLRESLAAAGVDTRGLLTDAEYFTTLAFVRLGGGGERSFSFARNFGADTRLSPHELPEDILTGTRLLHFGTIAMTGEPERSAQVRAVELARSAGALLAFDPNYRANLWPDERAFRRAVDELLPLADLVKLSDEETVLVTGERDPEQALDALLSRGASAAVVTLGSRGAVAAGQKAGAVYCEGVRCRPLDTTGAGDAFWGAFLTQVLKRGKAPGELDAEELRGCTAFANGVGAYCAAHFGAISGMPAPEQLERFLSEVGCL